MGTPSMSIKTLSLNFSYLQDTSSKVCKQRHDMKSQTHLWVTGRASQHQNPLCTRFLLTYANPGRRQVALRPGCTHVQMPNYSLRDSERHWRSPLERGSSRLLMLFILSPLTRRRGKGEGTRCRSQTQILFIWV